jgi:hypothetical protein
MSSWWNPFKKKEEAEGAAATAEPGAQQDAGIPVPELPPELANDPKAKGMMALFYRKWKDPAFLKQLKVLAAHMQKDGVNMKDMKAVQAWIEAHKDDIAKGKLQELPAGGAKQETFVKTGPDLGPNDPCSCGSGKKYKKCCKNKE